MDTFPSRGRSSQVHREPPSTPPPHEDPHSCNNLSSRSNAVQICSQARCPGIEEHERGDSQLHSQRPQTMWPVRTTSCFLTHQTKMEGPALTPSWICWAVQTNWWGKCTEKRLLSSATHKYAKSLLGPDTSSAQHLTSSLPRGHCAHVQIRELDIKEGT